MTFSLAVEALASVKNTSPNQVWFFVMSDRSGKAIVREAHICASTAKRRARLAGGCVRVGRVIGGRASTM